MFKIDKALYACLNIYLVGLVIIVFFWGLICKVLNISQIVQANFVLFYDLIPVVFYFLFFKINFSLSKKSLNSFKIIAIPIIFSFLLIFSTYYNGGNIIDAITRLGAIFRYFPLALFIYSLKTPLKLRLTNKILKIIYVIFIVEIIYGFLQTLLNEEYLIYTIPQTTNIYSSASRAILFGEIGGTFANTVDYAFTLIISYALLLTFKRIRFKSLITLLTLYLVYRSGSLAATGLFIYFLYSQTGPKFKKYFLLILSFFLISIMFFSYYTYKDDILNLYLLLIQSRLGIILFTLPQFIEGNFIVSLIGLGADQEIVYNAIVNQTIIPAIFINDSNVNALDDVYYVSTMLYSGILGLILLYYFFYKVYLLLKIQIKDLNKKKLLNYIFVLILFGSLFNQILHIRPFTVIFWLIIGVIFTKKKLNESTSN